eukprot:COSAG02_NODE_16848_length_1051_cov_1.029412_1_plen_253_part_01
MATTGRRRSLAPALALDAELNEDEESGSVRVGSEPEPEPEPEQEPGQQEPGLGRKEQLLSCISSAGGTESSPAATPPSDAVTASANEDLVSGGKAGVAAATSLAAVASSLDIALKTSAAATKMKKRARKKKPKNVVSRLYQTPKPAKGAVGGAVAASNSRGSLAAATLSKTKAVARTENSSGAEAGLPAAGKGKLAALVSKNVLPAVEKNTVAKGGMAAVVKKAQKKYTGADRCKDLNGKRYDIKEFRCVHTA